MALPNNAVPPMAVRVPEFVSGFRVTTGAVTFAVVEGTIVTGVVETGITTEVVVMFG